MIKAIIVEDDPRDTIALQSLLLRSSVNIEILTVCTNVTDAAGAISEHKPDVIFLDIDLDRGENGFDLLKLFPRPEFSVIFTTQHNNTHNTIRAIRACALDFLPKPVLLADLKDALDRIDMKDGPARTASLGDNLASGKLKYIWLTDRQARIMVEIENIIYCNSQNSYTKFYLAQPVDGKLEYTESKNIKTWEQDLAGSTIIRTHREFLVNMKYIAKYYGTHFILTNGTEALVARNRREEVEKHVESFRWGR